MVGRYALYAKASRIELNWTKLNSKISDFISESLFHLLCVLGNRRLVRRSRELGAVVIHVPDGDQQTAEMKSKRYHQLYHNHSRDVAPNLENHHSHSSSMMDLAPGPNNLSAALSSEILHEHIKSHLLHHLPGKDCHIFSICWCQCFCVENGYWDEHHPTMSYFHIKEKEARNHNSKPVQDSRSGELSGSGVERKQAFQSFDANL